MSCSNNEQDKCKKCGKCCYFALFDEENRVIKRTDVRCPHLTLDNLCSTYNNRPNWCKTAEWMAEHDVLPEGCGYLEVT